jgi:hypothetical protein
MWLINILVLVRCQGIYYEEGGRGVCYGARGTGQICLLSVLFFPSIIFPPMKRTRRKSFTVLYTGSLELTASLIKPLK